MEKRQGQNLLALFEISHANRTLLFVLADIYLGTLKAIRLVSRPGQLGKHISINRFDIVS